MEAVEAGEVSTGCVAELGQRRGQEGVGMVGRGGELRNQGTALPGTHGTRFLHMPLPRNLRWT